MQIQCNNLVGFSSINQISIVSRQVNAACCMLHVACFPIADHNGNFYCIELLFVYLSMYYTIVYCAFLSWLSLVCKLLSIFWVSRFQRTPRKRHEFSVNLSFSVPSHPCTERSLFEFYYLLLLLLPMKRITYELCTPTNLPYNQPYNQPNNRLLSLSVAGVCVANNKF